jgi:hypothetical protein
MQGSPMMERHARPPVVEMTEEQLQARAAYFFEQACVLHQQFEQLRAQKTKNGGGGGEPTLDYFEVSQLSRLCGLQLDPAAMSRALEDMDPDRTGVVSFADFEAWWKASFFSASGATSSRASSASIGAVLALAEAQE